MYYSHFLSREPTKVKEYKLYATLINKTKTKAKNEYYNRCFQLHQNNLKETWKLIGTIIKRKTKGLSNCPSRIIRDNKVYTNGLDIATQFNHHFTNIGANLASSTGTIMVIPQNT